MAEVLTRSLKEVHIPRPEFNGGSFTISKFSPDPEGFQLVTRKNIGRTEGIASNHLDPDRIARIASHNEAINDAKLSGGMPGEITPLTDERNDARREELGPNAVKLRDAMRGELKFNNAQEVRDARQSWHDAIRRGARKDEVHALRDAFYDKRKAYQERGKKLKLRNIEVDGNVVSVDAGLVSFPVYREFAREEHGAEKVDLSANAATAMIVRSADGRLVIQHRAVSNQRLTESKLTRGNDLFNDVPGASVAGMLDATLDGKDRKPGTPDPVTTDTILGNSYKEAGEELGLGPEHLDKVRIVGIAHDKIQIHDELLLLADSSLTADEIRETSRTSKRNVGLGGADFEEKFIDIDGSADSIATLLTKVQCPLPPTHAAALVAAGYSVVLQEDGKDAADAWRTEVEKGVQQNYAAIDKKVKDFYDEHPTALTQVPERFWGKRAPARKLHGYDPAYAPEEQGLPSFEDAMVVAGLMPETRTIVPEADLFDVDGVITDPTEKRVIHEEILDHIHKRLKDGIPVALNTGRSVAWLDDSILAPLLKRFADDKTGLQNLAIIAEFGGTWVTFDAAGVMRGGGVNSITVPYDFYSRVRELVDDRFSGTMFDDTTKETMISVEMNGQDLDAFHAEQVRLASELNAILDEMGYGGTYEVHTDTIATNVRSPYVGKALGADRFLQFLRDKGIKPAKYNTFGDSAGDIEMAKELHRRGQDVEFVYVGDPTQLPDQPTGFRTHVIGGYSGGTAQFLASQ